MKLLTFAEANPAACIQLVGGREIVLNRLVQSQTYAGLLLGLPNPSINDHILEAALKHAREDFGDLAEPCLIEPVKLPFSVPMQRRRVNKQGVTVEEGEIEERKGERLPLVRCVGSFRCLFTVKPEEEPAFFGYSAATVVWFQDQYAMPIAPSVLDKIRCLDWTRVAVDLVD